MRIYSYRLSKSFYLKGVILLGLFFFAPMNYNFSICGNPFYCSENKAAIASIVFLVFFLVYFLNIFVIDYITNKGCIVLGEDHIQLRPIWFFSTSLIYKRHQIYEKKVVKNGKKNVIQFFIKGRKLKREIDLSLLKGTEIEIFVEDFFK